MTADLLQAVEVGVNLRVGFAGTLVVQVNEFAQFLGEEGLLFGSRATFVEASSYFFGNDLLEHLRLLSPAKERELVAMHDN